MTPLFYCPGFILRSQANKIICLYSRSTASYRMGIYCSCLQFFKQKFFFFFRNCVIELCRDHYTLVSCSPFYQFGSKVRWLCTSSCSTCLADDHIPYCISKPHLRNEKSLESSTMCFLPSRNPKSTGVILPLIQDIVL